MNVIDRVTVEGHHNLVSVMKSIFMCIQWISNT